LNTLICIYAVGYAAWSIAGVVNDFRSKYSLWVVALNVLVSSAAVLGMYFYLTQSAPIATLKLWKAVAIAIVLGEIVLLTIDAYDSVKEEHEDKSIVIASLLVSLALMSPALIINYLLAFQR
jgi:hypothetical protein